MSTKCSKQFRKCQEACSEWKDEEFRELAKSELDALQKENETLEEEIKFLLVPADPEDGKNAIMEIRAGTGGDKASILQEIYTVCTRSLERKGFRIELVDMTEGTAGDSKK